MLPNSNAYVRYRQVVQAEHEAVLLLCHAVPALNAYMKAVEKGAAPKLPDADHFGPPQPPDRLKGIMPRYRKVLGRMLFIASFSYFEAYFKDLVKEVVAFHGGAETWTAVAQNRTAAASVPSIARDSLAEPKKGWRRQHYRKSIDVLASDASFQFPSERMAAFGITQLAERIDDLRAREIEAIAVGAFGVQTAGDQWEQYHKLRDQRNEIAHGRLDEFDLAAAIAAARQFTDLAKTIDAHIVKHFMLIEDA